MSYKDVSKLIWKTSMSGGFMTEKIFLSQTVGPITEGAYKRGRGGQGAFKRPFTDDNKISKL